MKVDQVPQDNSHTYSGHKRVVYAATEQGHYTKVKSSGWKIEEFATELALQDIEQLTEQAKQAWLSQKQSALNYLMHKYRYDLLTLAQVTGFFRWQIRRHFNRKIFNKLSDKKLQKYALAFNLSIKQIRHMGDIK